MSELKYQLMLNKDMSWVPCYLKSEADKVIAELKNRIAPKQSDKTLQERLNEVCKKHAVSTLQDLDWSFCMVEARLEDYTKLAADKHKALEKMLQYKVLYKEMCRDINTQERFFAMKVAHANYKRCLAMADKCVDLCHKAKDLYRWAEDENLEHHYNRKIEFFARWHNRWLKIAEKFKEAK